MSLFEDLPEPSASVSPEVNVKWDSTTEKDSDAPGAAVYPFISSVKSMKGERPEMQDAHVCIDDLMATSHWQIKDEVFRLSYFAVFDGHGGSRASTFASKQLHRHLLSRIPRGGVKQIEKDIKRVIIDSYKKTDEEFLRQACHSRPHWRDGSTSASLLLVNNTLYIANLGDSKIVLARCIGENATELDNIAKETDHNGNGDTTQTSQIRLAARCLTRDHNPVDYEERQRIQATGANVQNGRVNGILEVSRSFGDYQFKKQGVTCIPDIGKCVLTQQDRFIIVACDGLWKSFPPDEAVQLTNRLLLKEIVDRRKQHGTNPNASSESSMALTAHQVDAVCHQLTSEAVLRMSGDNVTCILIVFPDAYGSAVLSTLSAVESGVTDSRSGTDSPGNPADVQPPLNKIPRTS